MDNARCLGGDADLFFPTGRGSADSVYAYRICFDCPVIDDCLDHALNVAPNDDFGVWGATSERQRIEIRNGRATIGQTWADNRRRIEHHTPNPPVFTEPEPAVDLVVCTVEGCGRDIRARGWCEPHYRRWKNHGDVYADVPIAPNSGRPLPVEQREAS